MNTVKEQRQQAHFQRQFIMAFIELTNIDKAAVLACLMSLSATQHGKPSEAEEWWQVVAILRPDVAHKCDSPLTLNVAQKITDISLLASH